MTIVFLIAATLAALIHVYIFVLEVFLWTTPKTRQTFAMSAEEANATKEMAANQGVYNGALALVVLAGVAVTLSGNIAGGRILVFAGVSVMTGAALYLLATAANKRSAAIKQLIFPAATLVALFLLTL